jgi:hypothetical protein
MHEAHGVLLEALEAQEAAAPGVAPPLSRVMEEVREARDRGGLSKGGRRQQQSLKGTSMGRAQAVARAGSKARGGVAVTAW